MADEQYRKGLQYGIDAFLPAIQRTLAALKQELGADQHPMNPHVKELRGYLRAYCEVVGLLILECEQAQGKSVAERYATHKEYRAALEFSDDLLLKAPSLAGQVEVAEFDRKMIAAERRIDELALRYAAPSTDAGKAAAPATSLPN